MNRRFNTVLFDLGDTLLYFDDDWPRVFAEARQALLHSLQSAGLPLEQGFLDDFYARMQAYYRERETEFIEHTTRYVLRNSLEQWGYSGQSGEVIEQALSEMHKITQAHWIPEADALPTLQRLHSQGYRLGLISNAADDRNTQVLIDKGGFRPYLDVILSSAAEGIRKPNPRIFCNALARMGALAGQTVMVGDTLGADILGARNANIFSIWVTRRADTPANRAHADTIHPDARVATLAELPELLESLSAG
jgi:HAD superfamily hydrolase (TIGR01549 family)